MVRLWTTLTMMLPLFLVFFGGCADFRDEGWAASRPLGAGITHIITKLAGDKFGAFFHGGRAGHKVLVYILHLVKNRAQIIKSLVYTCAVFVNCVFAYKISA